jgi:hypothetical protein
MQREAEAMLNSAVELAFHMKGGLTYEEALDLCPAERDIITRFLERHYEAEKKAVQQVNKKR